MATTDTGSKDLDRLIEQLSELLEDDPPLERVLNLIRIEQQKLSERRDNERLELTRKDIENVIAYRAVMMEAQTRIAEAVEGCCERLATAVGGMAWNKNGEP